MTTEAVIGKYSSLIRRYTAGELSAEEFSNTYMDAFMDEDAEYDDEVYDALQSLFEDADAYCDDPDLRDEWDIGEAELSKSARETAAKLAEMN